MRGRVAWVTTARLLAGVLIVSSWAASAFAVEIVDQLHPSGSVFVVNGSSVLPTFMHAQTFTVGQAGTLSQLDFSLSVDNGATGDLIFTLLPTIGGLPNVNPANALFTTTVAIDTIDPFNFDDFFNASVDLSSAGIEVSPGDEFAWALDRQSPFSGNVFVSSGGSDYTGGQPFSRTNSFFTWNPTGNADLFFRTFVDTAGSSASLEIDPSVKANVELDNGVYVLENNPFFLVTQQSLLSGIDRRVVLEFPLAQVPANAVITEATLDGDITLRTTSGGNDPEVPVFGYEGDGIAEVNDAAVTTDLIGVSPSITENGPLTVDLDTAFVQGLLDSGATHLGLALIGDADRLQAGWDGFTNPPVLNLSFEIPAEADRDADGDVDLADLMAYQRDDGSAPGLSQWQSQFGDGEAIAAITVVPEPSTIATLCVAAAGWAVARRRSRPSA